jgi:hypothetical protein
MSDASVPAPYAGSDFSVGRVLNRTFSVLTRNFLTFFIVTTVASVPSVWLSQSGTFDATASPEEMLSSAGLLFLSLILTVVLYTLSQAIVLYAAFQDMRGRPVSLTESLQVGFRRFFPIIGLAICMWFVLIFAFMLFIVPGIILITMWFVATPACVVERTGPIRSLGRSRQLTKGHRWKIFGLLLLLILISAIISPTLTVALAAIGGTTLVLIGTLIWSGVWGAFYAIAGVVTYHDLRAAKEGIDIHQIAAVFD